MTFKIHEYMFTKMATEICVRYRERQNRSNRKF